MPHTPHPHLAAIGESLVRSFERHFGANREIQATLAELAFVDVAYEPGLARQLVAAGTSPIDHRA